MLIFRVYKSGMNSHSDIINAFGGPTKFAALLSEVAPSETFTPMRVWNWRIRGIPMAQRGTVHEAARRAGMGDLLADDFLWRF